MRFITLAFLCLLLATPAFAVKPKPSPVLEDGALLAWATGTATQSLTFSYSDYKKVFDTEQKNFTPGGWKGFQAAQAATLKAVIKYRQQVSTTTTKAPNSPLIKSKGQKKDGYQWTVSVPVIETIQAGNKKTQRKLSVTLTIGIVKNYPPVAGQSSLRILRWSEPGLAHPVKKKKPQAQPQPQPQSQVQPPATPLPAPVAPEKE